MICATDAWWILRRTAKNSTTSAEFKIEYVGLPSQRPSSRPGEPSRTHAFSQPAQHTPRNPFRVIPTNYVTGTQYAASSGITSLARGNGLTNSLAYNSPCRQRASRKSAAATTASHSTSHPTGSIQATKTTAPFGIYPPRRTGSTTTQCLRIRPQPNRLTSASEGSAWSLSSTAALIKVRKHVDADFSQQPVAPTANATYQQSAPNKGNINSTYDAAGNLTVFGLGRHQLRRLFIQPCRLPACSTPAAHHSHIAVRMLPKSNSGICRMMGSAIQPRRPYPYDKEIQNLPRE